MSKKMRYYRTAALLGPQEQHVAFRATPQPIKIPWGLVAVFAVVLAAVLWLNLDSAWFLMWDDLTVTGATAPEVVEDIKYASDLLGYHRFFLRPQRAVEPLLAAMPQFEEAEVRCKPFPTKCTIDITPRSPILIWVANGQRYWVDAAGVFYPSQGERPDLAVITGPVPEAVTVSDFTAVYQGIQALSALGISVNELVYSPRMGLIWTDPQGPRVAFGVGTEMAPRWQAYQAVIQHCAAQGITPRAVDARFPSGATYSLELTW